MARNSFVFTPATKTALKARIALEGVSGSGKTWTALTLARGMVGPTGRIAVADTERRKAALYNGVVTKFDHLALTTFDPSIMVDVLAAAADYDACIVDSFSHFWMGVDGMLEQVDRAGKSPKAGGNQFGGWKEMRPVERRMIDALLAYPGHLIVTLRSKSDYVIEVNDKGKNVPRKVGMKAEQREGLEYEFDLVGTLDLDNTLVFTKSRCPLFSGAVIAKPGEQVGRDIAAWLADGVDSGPSPLDMRDQALAAGVTLDELVELGRAAEAAGHSAAAVVDARTGNTVTLVELIRARWHEVKTQNGPSDKRHSRMHDLWREAGYEGDRDGRLSFTGEIIGRDVLSSKELTSTEADLVIERLKVFIAQQNQPAGGES